MGGYEKTYAKITDRIPKVKIDLEREQRVATSLRGTWSHCPDLIHKVEGLVGLENFPAGNTVRWAFWYDEVHYILEGNAEVTYTMPATRHAIEYKMMVEKGDAYLIPRGADITWKVDPSGPLKKLCVVMPAPQPYDPKLFPPGLFPEGSRVITTE